MQATAETAAPRAAARGAQGQGLSILVVLFLVGLIIPSIIQLGPLRLSVYRVVLLMVGLADGLRRTGMSTARPLLAGVNPRATFKALLDARAPLYREVATVEVDTARRSANQVARAVLLALGEIPADAPEPAADPHDPLDVPTPHESTLLPDPVRVPKD